MPDASAPTERSSHRVGDDVRHRPGCPAALRARLHRSQRIDAGHPMVAVKGHAVEGQADFGYDARVFVGTLG